MSVACHEAHHIAAPTWTRFRENFVDKRIVQFTATPFWNDGKNVDGTIVFNYPLLKAQEEGYFTTISFLPLVEFDERRADSLIAEKGIERLKADLAAGYDHILMARVKSIQRTAEVYQPGNLYLSMDRFLGRVTKWQVDS